MVLSFGDRANCDPIIDNLIISTFESIQLLHEKVDKISLEQVRTNEKVDQLQGSHYQLQGQIKSLEYKIGHGCNTIEKLNGSISSPVGN